jgi:MerR family transcriptional regulator, light-induced transcriptional regulator
LYDLAVPATSERQGHLRIGELSRRTGISTDLLRAWERRYRLLSPARTDGGYRLYDEHDVLRVQRMLEHLQSGVSAAQAAELAGSEPPGGSRRHARDSRTLALITGRLRSRLEQMDDVGAHATLDRLLSSFSLETVLRDAVLPYLQDLGERWRAGDTVIAKEHFASALLRPRLLELGRGWGAGSGPLALLACVPGDQHDIGLICFGLTLRGYGWRIAFLGADTPIATVDETARALDPELVVLAASVSGGTGACEQELRELACWAPLALAGGGCNREQATELGAAYIAEDPMRGAARVFGEGLGEEGDRAGAPTAGDAAT